MIADVLIEKASRLAGDLKIKDVRAGLGYTCVQLEDERCGLAYTFRNDMGDSCGILPVAGRLIDMNAAKLITWARDRSRIKAAIGLAAINALLNDPKINWDTGNIMEAFKLSPEDSFGMVGDFEPILEKVKTMTDKVYVFEQNPNKGEGLYSDKDIPVYLPKCQYVLVTATSIINHTFDEVLYHCNNAKEIYVVGPSTPLCPEVMKEYGVTVLGGTVVKDPELILQIVSQGGGTMQMKPAVKQVLVRT
jgi:uncharacterized protein (DUF4213/DUF364 family)